MVTVELGHCCGQEKGTGLDSYKLAEEEEEEKEKRRRR
jgi:hypothetical protein